MKLLGMVAVVTGGASGIGSQSAMHSQKKVRP